MKQKRLVYFLCTGNSCRSQMAEGFAKALLPGDWEVKSAGLEAHGLNPLAIKAMEEVGINITNQSSDVICKEDLERAEIIITLCAHAAEHCPRIPSGCTHIHWPLDDPAKFTGTDAFKWLGFQMIRDDIKQRVLSFKEEYK